MSFAASRWAWSVTGLNMPQKFLLLAIADRANKQFVCWPSADRICRDTGMAEKTRAKHMRVLISAGLVQKIDRTGRSNMYRLPHVENWIANNPGVDTDDFHANESPETNNGTTTIPPVNLHSNPMQNYTTPPVNLHPEPIINLSIKNKEHMGGNSTEVVSEQKPGNPKSDTAPASPDRPTRGSRLSIEALPENWRAWAETQTPGIDAIETWETFRDYWIAIPGQRGVKLDWQATWRNWCRRDAQGAARRSPRKDSGNFIEAYRRKAMEREGYAPDAEIVFE